MRPYFKWTQVFFFRLFEFIINDSDFQIVTKLVIIPLCLVKDEKLYTESETWNFHAPLADEILERLFGFYEHFDDLCFFFPKSFIDLEKISQQLDGHGLSVYFLWFCGTLIYSCGLFILNCFFNRTSNGTSV
jgi:hypothetical protein